MPRIGKSHVIMLVVGLVLGAIALGVVQAAMSVTSEVRIGVKRLEDGRVEVKLQQLEAEAGWGDLESPPARFLAADSTIDQWHYSNAIEVTGTVEEEEPEVVAAPQTAGDVRLRSRLSGG